MLGLIEGESFFFLEWAFFDLVPESGGWGLVEVVLEVVPSGGA